MNILNMKGIGGKNVFLDAWLANDPMGFKKQEYEKQLREQAKKKQDEYDIDDSFLTIDIE